MVTFKDLFHYVYDRNAYFHLSIPDEFGNACAYVHKKVWALREDGSKSAIQKIEIDEFDYTRYTITLFNDDTIQLEEFTNPYGPNMKMPVYSEYFPLDTGITYEHWKDYRGTQFTLLLAAICKQLDDIIGKWIEEDTTATNTSKLCSKICDTTYLDNTNDECEFTVPAASDVPPPELYDEPTFRTVMNALLDIFKSRDQKKKIGEYEILAIFHSDKEPLSIYNKIHYKYIFGKADNETDGVNPSLFYLVFSANMRVDAMNNPQPVDDNGYQLTMTSSQESYTISDIDIPLITWTLSTDHDEEIHGFIDWLRIAFMDVHHTPLS